MAEVFYERSSAGLLASQPLTLPDQLTADEDWQVIQPQLEARLAGLRTWRWSWWAHWAEVARYTLPRRYHWLITANTFDRGSPVNDAIIDSTAAQAVNVCASGLWTGLTSPSRPWFDLDIGLPWVQKDQEAADWLYDTEQRIYAILAASNFYQVMAAAFMDVATFGTAPVLIYEDQEDIVRFFLPCAGEYFLSVGSKLTVETFYREFVFSVLAIVDMFGLENCPVSIRNAWAAGGASLDKEFIVAHAIEPNIPIRGRDGNKLLVVSKNFA